MSKVILTHEVTDFGLWFQRALVPDVMEDEVENVRSLGGRFELSLADGATSTVREIVVACGFPRFRHIPSELRDLPPELVSHSSDHAELADFGGRSVVVLGAGQSALETAALLHEHGAEVSVVSRKPRFFGNEPPEVGDRPLRRRVRAPRTGLGPGWRNVVYAELPPAVFRFPAETRVRLAREVLGPSGAWWLRSRIEQHVPVLEGHVLVGARAEGEGARLRFDMACGGRELAAEHVISATGYRVRVDSLAFLDASLASRLRKVAGAPALSSSFESSVPGLYFVGMAAANSFGPVMRFVCGSGFAARRVSRQLAAVTGRKQRRGGLMTAPSRVGAR